MEPTPCFMSHRDDRRLIGMAAGLVCLALLSTLASANPTPVPGKKPQLQANYGKLPLSFEINQGQTDAQVKFLARGQGYTLFLTPTETVLSLKKPQAKAKIPHSSAKSSSPSETVGTVLQMQLAGANSAPKAVGREPLPGYVNYLIGKDPGKWHTQVPTYGKVAYKNVYAGVDLVYYGNQGQLEYDFVVAPGADPSNIKLDFKGADKIEVNSDGELVLHTANGDLRMHKPVIYQEIGGSRRPIAGCYVIKAGQTVGFQVASYDARYPLIIDPVLIYSTYLGGSGFDVGQGIAVDQQGQVIVVGATTSSDFPTQNPLKQTFGGQSDAFIAQLTADGTALRYATYLGGNDSDEGFGIALGLLGQVYVTGYTASTDFPIKNALQPTYGGSADVFIAQLTADGTALRYATYLGGSGFEIGRDIAVDLLGQAYVTGETFSTNFPTKNAVQPTHGGFFDAFVAQLTADGTALRYSTYLGGDNEEVGFAIAVDLLGRASVTGRTMSSNFPTKNALQPALNGSSDAFIAQFTANGTALRYATYLGGGGDDNGAGIAVDLFSRAYVTGETHSPDFPIKNALQPTYGGNTDAFVVLLIPDGAALRYSTYLGGSEFDEGTDIVVDKRGQVYMTGQTDSSNFPTKNALQLTLSGGGGDAFVAKLTANGRAFLYSTFLGGSEEDQGESIALDKQGQAYVTGFTGSPDFPVKTSLQPTYGGGIFDAFVAKIRN